MKAESLNFVLAESATRCEQKTSPLFEIARVPVCLDHVASFIVNANHGVTRRAAKLGVADCIADCVWLTVPQATERQRVGISSTARVSLRGRASEAC